MTDASGEVFDMDGAKSSSKANGKSGSARSRSGLKKRIGGKTLPGMSSSPPSKHRRAHGGDVNPRYDDGDDSDSSFSSSSSPSHSSSSKAHSSLDWKTSPVAYAFSFLPYPYEITLFVIAAMTRFYRLAEPGAVVFDESHFGKFTAHYMRGSYVFDIHPPLGKMTFAALGWLMNYDPVPCDFDDIGTRYDPVNCEYWKLRAISATYGCMLVPVMFSIAKKLGASNIGATLAACLLIFDMLNLIESRLVLMDAQLMFYAAMSLWLGLKFWARYDPADGSKSQMTTREENLWCAAIGFICGCAVCIKWTALVTPGMVAVESTFGMWFVRRRRVEFRTLLKIAAVTIGTYTFWFMVHFWALPKTGDRASAFVPAEFSMPYEKTLLNHPEYDPDNQMSFFYTFPMLNYEMFLVNSKITQPHHWGSRFHQWVVNSRGVAYWGDSSYQLEPVKDFGLSRSVYLLGNPSVIWLCFMCIICFIACGFLYLRYRASTEVPDKVVRTLAMCSFCFTAWLLNLAPYIAVERSSFIYHYMPGLFYAELLTALALDRLFPKPIRKQAIGFVIASVFACFLYFSPWVYALPLTDDGVWARRWMQGWD